MYFCCVCRIHYESLVDYLIYILKPRNTCFLYFIIRRLQAMDRVLTSVSELSHAVSDYEETLLSHSTVSADTNQVHNTYRDVQVGGVWLLERGWGRSLSVLTWCGYCNCCCCCRPTPPACSCGGVRQPSFSREALPGVSST